MTEIPVEPRNVAGTEAALGWAGARTLVFDRAGGVDGGLGLGFNGGSCSHCLCSDLRHVGQAMGAAGELDRRELGRARLPGRRPGRPPCR